MELYTKEDLINRLKSIFNQGWHPSVKTTRNTRNDGAVGNTLESLLGIEENNLPIPNANEWELKGQRFQTSSLITLKHSEPSPKSAKIVPNLLLPYYGWKHKQAGKKYPENEMSFRSTTSAVNYTSRGFRIVVDDTNQKIKFIFDAQKTNLKDKEIRNWLKSVKKRIGLSPLEPEPYWGFEDLKYLIGSKIRNCFYVIADCKVVDKKEHFLYKELFVLSGFSFKGFIQCIRDGVVLIDFDARSGHNHGTKFRLKQGNWKSLYSSVNKIV